MDTERNKASIGIIVTQDIQNFRAAIEEEIASWRVGERAQSDWVLGTEVKREPLLAWYWVTVYLARFYELNLDSCQSRIVVVRFFASWLYTSFEAYRHTARLTSWTPIYFPIKPEARKHLGHLEKKKDYKLRADDYNAKKAELQLLHKRALDRNPDEFYFHMVNAETRSDGTHVDKAKQAVVTPEQLLLMQTQDYRYIATRRNLEAKKVNRLQSKLHQLEDQTPNQHTFFVDNERQVKQFNLAKRLDVPKELLKRRYNRLRTGDLMKMNLAANPETLQTVGKERSKAYKELSQRTERQKKLMTLQRKMEIKMALQDKKRTVKSRIKPESKDDAPVYEWKWERKR